MRSKSFIMSCLIFVSLVTALQSVSSAQTLKETTDWLILRLNENELRKQDQWIVGDSVVHDRRGTGGSNVYEYIEGQEITDISYKYEPGHTDGDVTYTESHVIILRGPVKEGGAVGEGKYVGFDLYISLDPQTPKETVDRIMKALRHFATLKGAKLPNDDLFK